MEPLPGGVRVDDARRAQVALTEALQLQKSASGMSGGQALGESQERIGDPRHGRGDDQRLPVLVVENDGGDVEDS